ncbi:hypothetical protein [Kordiimonas gwangyangensis]|uniref:hypothetical protein n=1 Tax=Kordiimonas gwangyangensis TaxID=288022 RepID=UPI0006882920|nr:hypothetical protein [Kordiimonas gwangyangensis]
MNTLLYHIAGVTSGLTDWLSAAAMLLFQSSINFVVVSGSGQAALTMPLMTPLADLSGVSDRPRFWRSSLGTG